MLITDLNPKMVRLLRALKEKGSLTQREQTIYSGSWRLVKFILKQNGLIAETVNNRREVMICLSPRGDKALDLIDFFEAL